MIIVKNRELLIPNNERYIGTTYDNDTENRVFQVPRFSQRGVDLANLTFRLDIQYANESYDTVVLDKEVGEAFVILIWRITSATLQVPGTLYIGLRAVDDEATVKWSSFSAAMYAERHLNTPGNYGGSLTEIEQMEQDHQYMKGVIDNLNQHIAYKTADAEAWARGTREGHPVDSEDETYQNNAKYYSDLREEATHLAEAWAKGTRDGVDLPEGETGYHDNAKYWKTVSEGWAHGGTGTHTNEQTDNSKYWSEISHAYANQVSYKKVYANVAEMVADTELVDGQVVRTLGYYAVNDGGGALYRVESTAPVTYYETLSNGLYATLIIEGVVYPEMFGAHGDGTTDDTDAINAALNAATEVVLLSKTYITTRPIFVRSYTTLRGSDKNTSRIKNIGTGFNKNAVIAGFLNGDTSTQGGIRHTSAVSFSKIGKYTFTTSRSLQVHDVVHFKVAAEDTSTSQKVSTSTYIISKNGNTYVTRDPIPDNAELHLYADLTGTTDVGKNPYVTFGTTIQNLTVEHLPTGSGMYCLFICGAEFAVKDINIIGNTGMASNMSCHGVWENIHVTSYADNLDCAEYVYYTSYKNIVVEKAAISAEIQNSQLAFGRGHGNNICRFKSNIENQLALAYTTDVIFEECDISINHIAMVEGNEVSFKKCNIYSSDVINPWNLNYEECYFEKPVLSSTNKALIVGCESDYANINVEAKEKIHKVGYKKQQRLKAGTFTQYEVPDFDYAYVVTVTGSNLSVSIGQRTLTATKELSLIKTPNGSFRLQTDYGGYISPGLSYIDPLVFSGSITTIELEPFAH